MTAGVAPVLGEAEAATDLIAGADRVAILAAPRAAAADRSGMLASEVVAEVVRAGFARHFVPAKWGGTSGGYVEMVPALARVGAACPATGWLASLAATLGRIAAYLPMEGQGSLWEAGPDPLVVGSLLPLGSATRQGEDWSVEGVWPYVSAVKSSDWALVLAKVEDGDTSGPRFFAVPRKAYRIHDTWDQIGMRATASHTLVLPRTTVPDALSFARSDLDEGTPSTADTPGLNVPLEAVAGLAFAPPLLGAARGALASWMELARENVTPGGRSRPTRMDRAHYEITLTRSSTEVDAAELLLNRVAALADSSTTLTPRQVAECARDCAFATELLKTAVDRCVNTGGTSVFAAQHALQRHWRDLYTGAGHVMLQMPRAAKGYARVVFP
jgi:two-component flavin-dependent monooxygenase